MRKLKIQRKQDHACLTWRRLHMGQIWRVKFPVFLQERILKMKFVQCVMINSKKKISNEKEEWQLLGAVRIDGKTFHPLCGEDYKVVPLWMPDLVTLSDSQWFISKEILLQPQSSRPGKFQCGPLQWIDVGHPNMRCGRWELEPNNPWRHERTLVSLTRSSLGQSSRPKPKIWLHLS